MMRGTWHEVCRTVRPGPTTAVPSIARDWHASDTQRVIKLT